MKALRVSSLLLLLWLLLTPVLLLVPVDAAAADWPSLPHADKIVHAALFALGAGLLHRRPLPLAAALALAFAYGAVLEGVQLAVPHRSGEGADLLANAMGAGAYALAALGWRGWRGIR